MKEEARGNRGKGERETPSRGGKNRTPQRRVKSGPRIGHKGGTEDTEEKVNWPQKRKREEKGADQTADTQQKNEKKTKKNNCAPGRAGSVAFVCIAGGL